MSERVAIVAGAGGELGRATAEKLAAAGFTVVGVDRSEEGLKELPDGVRRETADSADPAAARAVVDRIAAAVGPPEVLVNTLGTYALGDALTTTPDDLRLMIDVNLGAALWLTQAVVPYLRARGSGSIVHVSARPGLEPTAGMAAYAVSKAALVHLVRVLDLELRPLGIRVNAVAPGSVRTPMLGFKSDDLTPEQIQSLAKREAGTVSPYGNAMMDPSDIAEVVLFLASDAARGLQGSLVLADQGISSAMPAPG